MKFDKEISDWIYENMEPILSDYYYDKITVNEMRERLKELKNRPDIPSKVAKIMHVRYTTSGLIDKFIDNCDSPNAKKYIGMFVKKKDGL